MAMWFYQMSQGLWPPGSYRLDIWENERWTWSVPTKRGTRDPEPGDRVVFFYAPSRGEEGGFYGWAVVLDWRHDEEGKRIYFRPVAPSDHLKMDPWWDPDAKRIADEVRGQVKRATLWPVRDELAKKISAGITAWLSRSAGHGRAPNQRGNA